MLPLRNGIMLYIWNLFSNPFCFKFKFFFLKYPDFSTWTNKIEESRLSSILFYPAWYSSLVGSGTKLGKLKKKELIKLSLPSLVPELGGLGYFMKYPSPPSSSTKLGK